MIASVALVPLLLIFPYIVGTVSGSLFGAEISMRVERWLGAKT